MFTGIIQEVGVVKQVKVLDGGKEISIDCSFTDELKIDQSISINGVCHTVTAKENGRFIVQSVEETLRKTNMGDLDEESPVNLERSLRPDQLLDGHLVQGHVDATGAILKIVREGTDRLITVQYPEEYSDLVVGRGSIALDGISLTIADEQESRFTVAVIPYTLEHTNLSLKEEGDIVNLEFDILGKYVVKYLARRNSDHH